MISWMAGAGLLLLIADPVDPVSTYLAATTPAEREMLDSLVLSCRELLTKDDALVAAKAASCGERINQWLVTYYGGPKSPSQALFRTINLIQLYAETYGVVPNPGELAATLDRLHPNWAAKPGS
jgi:hypothetical protein